MVVVKYSVVLFDIDGTLVDHDAAARRAAFGWCVELGVEPDVGRWLALEQTWFSRFERGVCSHEGQRLGRVREFLGGDLSDERARELFGRFLRRYEENWVAFADAHPTLQRVMCSGVRVGFFTNGAHDLQLAKLTRTGLWEEGLLMFATKELGVAKPNPRAYELVQAELGVPPEEILMVGDNITNDVEAARAAGWDAFHVVRPEPGLKGLEHHMCNQAQNAEK